MDYSMRSKLGNVSRNDYFEDFEYSYIIYTVLIISGYYSGFFVRMAVRDFGQLHHCQTFLTLVRAIIFYIAI
jgi:hypothetical protein